MNLADFQQRIRDMYFDKDSRRGLEGTFMWFVEEVGELSTALRCETKKQQEEEFADVLAWLVSLASIAGIDMTQAIEKYANGCPGCHQTPCSCSPKT